MAAAAAAAATEASAADGAAFSGQRKGSDGRIEFCYQGVWRGDCCVQPEGFADGFWWVQVAACTVGIRRWKK